jgi:hypothetical protein
VGGVVRRLAGRPWMIFLMSGCGQDTVAPTVPDTLLPSRRGSLEIITTSSGSGADTDGYELTLNRVVVSRMGTTDTLLVASVPVADYSMGLADVATHCKVGGSNPRAIRVEPDVSTRVIFVIKCDPAPGSPTS